MTENEAYFEFLCRMGDNTLILGHRISELCPRAQNFRMVRTRACT